LFSFYNNIVYYIGKPISSSDYKQAMALVNPIIKNPNPNPLITLPTTNTSDIPVDESQNITSVANMELADTDTGVVCSSTKENILEIKKGESENTKVAVDQSTDNLNKKRRRITPMIISTSAPDSVDMKVTMKSPGDNNTITKTNTVIIPTATGNTTTTTASYNITNDTTVLVADNQMDQINDSTIDNNKPNDTIDRNVLLNNNNNNNNNTTPTSITPLATNTTTSVKKRITPQLIRIDC
jgi:hypothetical protein